MRKREIMKDYGYFQIKRKVSENGDQYVYVENQDKVEFIFIYNGEIYWRSESTPAHSSNNQEFNYYPFSGTIEDDEMPYQAMLRKIEEEAGLVVQDGKKWYYGYFFESKHISSRVHLFIFEIKDAKKVPPRTDRIYWKSFGKTLAGNRAAFFKELNNKTIETTLSLEFMKNILKYIEIPSWK